MSFPVSTAFGRGVFRWNVSGGWTGRTMTMYKKNDTPEKISNSKK
jgi:hypothetical protein